MKRLGDKVVRDCCNCFHHQKERGSRPCNICFVRLYDKQNSVKKVLTKNWQGKGAISM